MRINRKVGAHIRVSKGIYGYCQFSSYFSISTDSYWLLRHGGKRWKHVREAMWPTENVQIIFQYMDGFNMHSFNITSDFGYRMLFFKDQLPSKIHLFTTSLAIIFYQFKPCYGLLSLNSVLRPRKKVCFL